MQLVTYHDPTSNSDLPAFIIAVHKANKKEGRKKRTADLLVCGLPDNFTVNYVDEGKGVRQFSI